MILWVSEKCSNCVCFNSGTCNQRYIGNRLELRFSDGRRQRMLESPYPKSPLSCSIFLHEVGHHAIGLGVVRPRCLEELRAWEWSLAAMEERGLEIDAKVRDRFRRSMEYAVAKAARRGIRELPIELLPFLPTTRSANR